MLIGARNVAAWLMIFAFLEGCTWGCELPPRPRCFADLWDDLSLYEKGSEEATEELQRRFATATSRREAVGFLAQAVKCRFLSHEDQMRMALVLRVLVREASSDNEHSKIAQLIIAGQQLADFFGHCLSADPHYIAITIHAVGSDEYFRMMDPVAGGSRREPVSKWAVWLLRKATDKDFGQDEARWRQWWQMEGRFLRYNPNTTKYKR